MYLPLVCDYDIPGHYSNGIAKFVDLILPLT